MNNKRIVEALTALANIASQGRYTVDPAGARRMNAVFDAVAAIINELEAEDSVTDLDIEEAIPTGETQ